MKKNNQSVPTWILGIIILLVLFIIFMFYILSINSKNNMGLSNTEKLCIKQCSLNQNLCNANVQVFDAKNDCFAEFSSCIDTC